MLQVQKSNLIKHFPNNLEGQVQAAHLKSLFNILDIKNNTSPVEFISLDDISYIIYRLCQKQHTLQLSLNYSENKKPVEIIKNEKLSECCRLIYELKLCYANFSIFEKLCLFTKRKFCNKESVKKYLKRTISHKSNLLSKNFSTERLYSILLETERPENNAD